jgi:D-glycero-D-manno-heptose 1,7-bisphosphate phosphatase
MLLQAAVEWNIDLSASFMVGDKKSDLLAAIAAGCHPYLVTTGYGGKHRTFAMAHNIDVCKDLGQAVNSILAKSADLLGTVIINDEKKS